MDLFEAINKNQKSLTPSIKPLWIIFLINLLTWGGYFALIHFSFIPSMSPPWMLSFGVSGILSFILWIKVGLHSKRLAIGHIDKRRNQIRFWNDTFTRILNFTFILISLYTLTTLFMGALLFARSLWQLLHGHGGVSQLVVIAVMLLGNPVGCLALWSILVQTFGGVDDKLRSADLPIWRKPWTRFFVSARLLRANAAEREQYTLHGHWRVQVYFTQLYRRWQYFEVGRGLAKQRWLWVLLVASASVFIAPFLINFIDTRLNLHLHEALAGKNAGNHAGAQASSIIIFLLSSGVLFTLWFFRDQNALWQIENSRKDVNLKDFQRISEWAAGMHLPEDKETQVTKEIDAKAPQDKCTETSTSIERSKSPKTQHALTRREGGEALQIAAIYQMASFLNGEFGQHFQRPAFRLLTSIYQNLYPEVPNEFSQYAAIEQFIQKITNLTASTHPSITARQAREDFQESIDTWRSQIQTKSQDGIITALDATLLHQHGRVLRQNAGDLPALIFHCMNTRRSMLPHSIELSYLNLSGLQAIGANLSGAQLQGAILRDAQLQGAYLIIAQLQGAKLSEAQLQGANLSFVQLQGAKLSEAQLQGADLRGAQLQGADLSKVQLQGAVLRAAELQGADLSGAQLQGADLIIAQLQGAKLSDAKLQGADLSDAQLQGAYLSDAQLQGADLSGAQLQGATLINIKRDEQTRWHNCCTDETLFIQAEKIFDNDYRTYYLIRREDTRRLHDVLNKAGVTIDPNAIPTDKNAYDPATGEWVQIDTTKVRRFK